jgi:hypothetical protein
VVKTHQLLRDITATDGRILIKYLKSLADYHSHQPIQLLPLRAPLSSPPATPFT